MKIKCIQVLSHQEIRMWPGYGLRWLKWKMLLLFREQTQLMPSGAFHRSGEERKDAVKSIRGNKRQKI